MKDKWILKIKPSDYFGILLFIILCCIGIYKINISFTMNDAFWHIKTGEWLEQYGIIQKCYGSWVIGNEPWVAHEWLFGWLLYCLAEVDLIYIVYACHFLFLINVILCFIQAKVFKPQNNPPALYWMIVLLPQFTVYASMTIARPQYVSVLLITLYILILNQSIVKNRIILLYALPFIAILWVNIHGGTAMLSYGMIIIYLLCGCAGYLIEDIGRIRFVKRDKKWCIHAGIVLFLTVIAICVNPYGYKMLIYPYENMQDTLMLKIIEEWAAPDAKNMVSLLLEFIPMLLGIVALIHCDRKIAVEDVAIFFLYVILFLRSERFYPYLAVVQTCLITKYAFRIKCRGIFKKKSTEEINIVSVTDKLNDALMILLGTIGIVFCLYSLINAQYNANGQNEVISDELLEIIKKDNPQRLLNNYNAGSYLIYHDIDVFIDGRYEPYQKQGIMTDYLAMMNTSNYEEVKKIDNLLEKYKFDAYLLSHYNYNLIEKLNKTDSVELVYEDNEWLYYVCKDK